MSSIVASCEQTISPGHLARRVDDSSGKVGPEHFFWRRLRSLVALHGASSNPWSCRRLAWVGGSLQDSAIDLEWLHASPCLMSQADSWLARCSLIYRSTHLPHEGHGLTHFPQLCPHATRELPTLASPD